MKKISLFLLMSVIFATGNAKQISERQAASIAGKYLETRTRTLKALNNKSDAEYYVFNAAKSKGFVIISGDDELTELVGYSDKGSFSTANMPENLRYWLKGYANYVKMFREGKANADKKVYNKANVIVEPLLKTKWSQSNPYNKFCPTDGYGRECPTGCAATAFAQVMKYWQWPDVGTGTHSYTNDYRTETVDFSKSRYDWNNMLDEYLYLKNQSGYITENWTAVQGNAVAKLMYDCGVALNMEYNPQGSGASDYDIKYSAAENFKYDSKLFPRDSYTSPQFIKIILDELDLKHPILFGGQGTGGGHEFVADGYDSNHYLHINWGWSGQSDGFFNIDYMSPEDLGTGGGAGGFNYQQSIVIITPNKTGNPTYNDDYLCIYTEDYGGGIKAVDQKAKKGELLRLAVTGVWNSGTRTYDGILGFAVFDVEGNQLTTPENTDVINLEGSYLTTDPTIIPLGSEINVLQDGMYYVYLMCKQQHSDKASEWVRVASDENVMILVSGDEVSVYDEDLSLEVEKPISVSKKFVAPRETITFTTSLLNTSSQTAEGNIMLTVSEEGTNKAILQKKFPVLIYNRNSLTFDTDLYISNAFEIGKNYKFTVAPSFESKNGFDFSVYSQPCDASGFSVIDPAGVDDLFAEENIIVYPNPTTNRAFIISESEIVSIKLIASDGRLMKELSNAKEIDLTDCPAGYYILRIATEKGLISKQIIKK